MLCSKYDVNIVNPLEKNEYDILSAKLDTLSNDYIIKRIMSSQKCE